MRTKIGLALVLAALLPFGCKCLSSEQTEPPDEQAEMSPGGPHAPRFEPGRPRVLDPKKARMLKFSDRLRVTADRPQAPLGSGLPPPGAQPASHPASPAASQPATQPGAPAATARPPTSVKAQY